MQYTPTDLTFRSKYVQQLALLLQQRLGYKDGPVTVSVIPNSLIQETQVIILEVECAHVCSIDHVKYVYMAESINTQITTMLTHEHNVIWGIVPTPQPMTHLVHHSKSSLQITSSLKIMEQALTTLNQSVFSQIIHSLFLFQGCKWKKYISKSLS